MTCFSIQTRGALNQEEGFSLPPLILRSSEHEETGGKQSRAEQLSLSEQSNLLRRESLSQLPQPLLVAVFKLVLWRAFVGSDSFGQVLQHI